MGSACINYFAPLAPPTLIFELGVVCLVPALVTPCRLQGRGAPRAAETSSLSRSAGICACWIDFLVTIRTADTDCHGGGAPTSEGAWAGSLNDTTGFEDECGWEWWWRGRGGGVRQKDIETFVDVPRVLAASTLTITIDLPTCCAWPQGK